ncbi:hypothetical protein BD779DRAFT_1472146 [Infundibulicybe gibba]|nr:hypothetical protein BD779DRAFT_1472146 [Infundibulicybe gibba]
MCNAGAPLRLVCLALFWVCAVIPSRWRMRLGCNPEIPVHELGRDVVGNQHNAFDTCSCMHVLVKGVAGTVSHAHPTPNPVRPPHAPNLHIPSSRKKVATVALQCYNTHDRTFEHLNPHRYSKELPTAHRCAPQKSTATLTRLSSPLLSFVKSAFPTRLGLRLFRISDSISSSTN